MRCEDLPEYPTTARVQRGDPGPYSHPISEIYMTSGKAYNC
jgi:hypothetical protein